MIFKHYPTSCTVVCITCAVIRFKKLAFYIHDASYSFLILKNKYYKGYLIVTCLLCMDVVVIWCDSVGGF